MVGGDELWLRVGSDMLVRDRQAIGCDKIVGRNMKMFEKDGLVTDNGRFHKNKEVGSNEMVGMNTKKAGRAKLMSGNGNEFVTERKT